MQFFEKVWHRTFHRPYLLARTVDEGQGVPIVLLHGIGRSGRVWQYLVELLLPLGHRVVAFDLLGFGASPKPDWLDYTVDDHAQAVITSIEKLRFDQQVIIVGHSMGCLVAVRVARLRPDLVRHMVLFEMPLYEGLPQKKRYRLRTDLYLKFYAKVIAYQPAFNPTTAKLAERLATKVIGMEITPESWQPFTKSLEHTIVKQNTAADMKQLAMPLDVIYGSFDMFVIRGKPQHIFDDASERITAHTIKARHRINLQSSQFILSRILAAES